MKTINNLSGIKIFNIKFRIILFLIIIILSVPTLILINSSLEGLNLYYIFYLTILSVGGFYAFMFINFYQISKGVSNKIYHFQSNRNIFIYFCHVSTSLYTISHQ